MKICVLSVNYYSGRFTELMIKSVITLNPKIDINVILFDNGSSDGSLNFIKNCTKPITVLHGENPYSIGSYSHGFAIDRLISEVDSSSVDVVLLLDTDCFSFEPNWLSDYAEKLISNELEMLGAPAFCPIVSDENRYLWPGFTLLSPKVIEFIQTNKLSCMPSSEDSKPNDSGQTMFSKAIDAGHRFEYLERTPPHNIGSVEMEKWSIDDKVHHFFAASMARGIQNPFRHIYGDKSRGRYITKRFQAWRMFRQKDVRDLLKHPV